MRLGVILSTAAHALLLVWSLIGLSAPEPLQVADVEALPVDIVPIEEFTRSIEGERTAALTETPAPKPTTEPDTVPDSENVGDAENDTRSNRDPDSDNPPVDSAREAALPDAPAPIEAPNNEPEKAPAEESVPAPTNEVTSKNEPAVPITEETQAETPPDPAESEQFAALDSVAAVPARRPDPPKPQTAETTERQSSQKPATTANAAKPDQDEQLTDEIASLLNKQDPGASGARRSSEPASLGTRRPSDVAELSTSEMDALRDAITNCWQQAGLIGMAGIEDVRSTVTVQLAQDGTIVGRPATATSGGPSQTQRAFEGSVVRAVRRCAPYSQLPREKYDTWSVVVINFSATDLR